MMTRIVAILFYAALLVVAGGLLLPGFIDWSQHREKIVSRIEPFLDRKIEVGGDVRFRILPSPQLALGDVTIANAEGAKSPHFMTLKNLEAKIRLLPLLQGRVEVESVNLSEPDIYFESGADGKPNWTGILAQNRKPSGFVGGVQLDEVTVTDGTLHYDSRITGASWIVNNVDLTVKSSSIAGPYAVTGAVQYKGRAVAVDMSTGAYVKGQPVAVNIGLKPDAGLPHMHFSGIIDLKNGFDAQGDIASEKGKVSALFDSAFLDDIDVLTENATFNAAFDFSGSRLKLSAIKLVFEEGGKASGDITVDYAAIRPRVTAKLQGSDVKITAGSDTLEAPQNFDADLELSGNGIVWEGRKMDTVRLTATARDGLWQVKQKPEEKAPPKKEPAPVVEKPVVEKKEPEKKAPPEKAVVEKEPAAIVPPVKEESVKAPPPPEETAPQAEVKKEDPDAIRGILNRLDEPDEMPEIEMPEMPEQPEPDAPPPAEQGLPELLQDAQMLPDEEEL
jgi:hypothetical protein